MTIVAYGNPGLRRHGFRSLSLSIVALALALATAGCSAPGDSADGVSVAAKPVPSPSSLPGASGPHLLYEWYPSGSGDKSQFLADARGKNVHEITADAAPSTEHVHSDWSTDGKHLAFEALSGSGPSSVWMANADGSGSKEFAACQGDPCLQISYPDFSPDGKSLLVVQYDKLPSGDWGKSHLVIIDLASGGRREIARTSSGKAAYYSPRWSPDGRSVVAQLESYPDASESEISGSVIALVSTVGKGIHAPVALTKPAMFAGHPDWHPRKDLIVFDTYDLSAFQTTDQPSNLYTMNSRGRHVKQLTKTATSDGIRPGEPTWSPDGSTILTTVGIIGGGGTLSSAELAYTDPVTGALDRLGVNGAGSRLQPS